MRLSFALLFAAAAMPCACVAQTGHPSNPVAVIDTTMGQLRCTLFAAQKPSTVAVFIDLAQGKADWAAGDTGGVVHSMQYYPGTPVRWQAGGIVLGTREKGVLADAAHQEPPTGMKLDRPGLLAMLGEDGKMGPRVMIYDHARAGADSDRASIFGECDAESVKLVSEMGHALASVENDPATPVDVTGVTIVPAGRPIPAAEPAPGAPRPRVVALKGPEPTGRTVVFETSMGNISCRLFEKESPIAVSTFLGLVDGSKEWTDPTTHQVMHGKRFYDGLEIERVIPDFVIQSGDVTNDPSGKTDIGFRFKNENTPGLTYDRPGRLAFGNGGKDTNNSEIFITEHPVHRLDGGYTIFGQCDPAGVKVVEAIARVPRDGKDRPLTKVVIQRVVVRP